MKIIENTILTVFLLAMLAVCWHLTFKEGGAWDYNMEQVEMSEGLKGFLETLHAARLQTRQDLQRARARVDELAEKEVELTAKIESVEATLEERGAA